VVEWRVNQSFKDHLHLRHQGTVDDPDAGGLFAIQPPDAAASPRIFDWIVLKVGSRIYLENQRAGRCSKHEDPLLRALGNTLIESCTSLGDIICRVTFLMLSLFL
jgi:hypothetical protein